MKINYLGDLNIQKFFHLKNFDLLELTVKSHNA